MTRIVLIFAAVAAVAAGGGYYFFKVHRPAQVKLDAQAEIAGWEARFQAARQCLLGASPGSSKTSEALALREMSPDPWNRGSCTPMVSKLSRGDAPDSGLPEVETAWTEIDHAAAKAATAFATHVAASTSVGEDPLPAALDALDGARARLRASADLPPAPQTGKPLPAATLVPLLDGKDPVVELELDAVPSAHGLVGYGKTASSTVQITFVTGGAPKVARDDAGRAMGDVRAVPDNSWGASPEAAGLRVGAFDQDGLMPSPGEVALANADVNDAVVLAAVLGTPSDGIIAYGNEHYLAIARGHGSEFVAAPSLRITSAIAGSDVDGRGVVAWISADKGSPRRARLLGPGPDTAPIELGATGVLANACLSADRAWLGGWHEVTAIGGAAPLYRYPAAQVPQPSYLGRLVGCTPEGALLRGTLTASDEGREPARTFAVCAPECRGAKMPAGAPDLAAATFVGGKLVAIATHGSVLAVWREDGGVTYFGLPHPERPAVYQDQGTHEWPLMALTDGKVIDLVAHSNRGYEIVRIPATPSS